ncbi:MAG: hypothetical protein ACYTEZ_16705 [Planctomycetota bacterium]|jgi:hypothetical protein
MKLRKILLVALLAATGTSAIAGKKPSNAFEVTITMEAVAYSHTLWIWDGNLRASGAISDSGPVMAPAGFIDHVISFDGKKGSFTVLVTDIQIIRTYYKGPYGKNKAISDLTAKYEIVDGTGVYEGVTAAGTGTGRHVDTYHNWFFTTKRTWTFEGNLNG